MSDKNIFQEFSDVSKDEWLAKVEKDLKGKPLSDLDWMVGDFKIPPFYHATDTIDRGAVQSSKQTNDWEISALIQTKDSKSANKLALEGLIGGVNAPVFYLADLSALRHEAKDNGELQVLLNEIELPYISTHFRGDLAVAEWKSLLDEIKGIAAERGYELAKLSGSLNVKNTSYQEIQGLLDHELTQWKVLQLAVPYAEKENSSEVLAILLLDAKKMIENTPVEQRDKVLEKLSISIAIGTSYFIEIAKLRALRLLWANLAKAYELSTDLPSLEVSLAQESHDENENTNMIRSTTQAMAAVIGGADRLVVIPSNLSKGEESTIFSQRIARNVQHLLKMESYLDRVIDPAAGSYYVEALTNQIAEKAWEIFQTKV